MSSDYYHTRKNADNLHEVDDVLLEQAVLKVETLFTPFLLDVEGILDFHIYEGGQRI